MDAATVAQRTELGLATFGVLSRLGVFGLRLREAQPTEETTQVVAMSDGEPLFVRFGFSGETAGYVDLALQPWLGDPVLVVAQDVRWDPRGFEAEALALGYKWRRWVSSAIGVVALDCGDGFLDPYRGHEGAPYKVPWSEATRPWGLSPQRRAANEQRYSAFVLAVAAGNPPGLLPAPQALPLCSAGGAAGKTPLCVPTFRQRFDVWCVPAVLEMSIEYFLAENKPWKYQGTLADSFRLPSSGSAMSSNDWDKIPKGVSDASGKHISCDLTAVQWDTVVREIAGPRPLVYMNYDHAYLIFGYSEVKNWASIPPIGYLSWVNPAGPLVVPGISFAALPDGTMVKFLGGQKTVSESVERLSWLARRWRMLKGTLLRTGICR